MSQPAPTDAGVLAGIRRAAQETGVPLSLALAIASHETGGTFDPNAVGDNGSSFGLYQLHQGGELGSLTPQQAKDPYTNARVALAEVASVLRSHPHATPGEVAVLAQRPAASVIPGYIADVNRQVSMGLSPSVAAGQPAPSHGVPGVLGHVGSAVGGALGYLNPITAPFAIGHALAPAIPDPLHGIEAVGNAANALTKRQTWTRVLYVVVGLGAIAAGGLLLERSTLSGAAGAVKGAMPAAAAGKVISAAPTAAAAAL